MGGGRENHQKAAEEQMEMRGKKKWDGKKIEHRQHGELITQGGTRGDTDERKEQRKMGREGTASG